LKLRDVSIKGAAFLSRLAKKWLSYGVGWMISNVPIVFAHLMGLWKKFKGGWHCKKGKRPSIHRRDD